MWLIFAILSAVFAAATAVLAKIGIDGVDSNLATAIRTVVVVIMAWAVVIVAHRIGHPGQSLGAMISSISSRSWLFIILSGIATGASWLCYFYAIKNGDVSKVVPIDKCSLVPLSSQSSFSANPLRGKPFWDVCSCSPEAF